MPRESLKRNKKYVFGYLKRAINNRPFTGNVKMLKKISSKKSIHKTTPTECHIKKRPYTAIPTETYRALTNSTDAVIWVFLLGYPPNWIIQKTHIQKQYGFSIRKIEDAFRRLQGFGLMKVTSVKDEKGKFIKHIWEVYSDPIDCV